MSIRKIIRLGHPTLSTCAQPVRNFNTSALNELIRDLFDTMAHVGGLGLAATQIDVNARVFVMGPSKVMPDFPTLAIINPEFTSDSILKQNWESCLSIPEMKGQVLRHDKISYTGRSADGKSVEGELSGWPSFIFQHELDHLNGITLIHKLTGPGMFGFRDEISSYHWTS